MTQNQDETYFHDLGHEGACTAFYRGCFGNFLGEPVLPCLMDLICFDGLQFHKWFLMVSEQLKTQLSGKGREPKFMFPKKELVNMFF